MKQYYLLDGRCEISNNRAERKSKSYAIGRKAFLFHTSEAGAGASAVRMCDRLYKGYLHHVNETWRRCPFCLVIT